MFYIKARAENLRIDAWSANGHVYQTEIMDVYNWSATVKRKQINLSHKELAMILQLWLWPAGAQEGSKTYLESIFKEWPQNLRPIP